MKVTLALIPAGESEATEDRDFEIPTLPRPGDKICFDRPRRERQYFVVKQIMWQMMTSVSENEAKEGRVTDEQGVTNGITIVCEHDRRRSRKAETE
jgi:hypothetical protein